MKKHLLLASLAIVSMLSSCKKSSDDAVSPGPSYSVPTSYNFSDAVYADAPIKYETTRLGMFKYMEAVMKKAIPSSSNASAAAVDSSTLVRIFMNSGAPFDTLRWNTCGLNLGDENSATTLIQTYLGRYAATSQAATYNGTATPTATAADGTAGLGANGTAYTLFDKYGINYAQLIQKTQFGSLVIYQIINRLNEISFLENTDPSTTYTSQESAWDEAFGYAGFPRYSVDSLSDNTIAATLSSKFFYVGNYARQTGNTTDLNATKTLVTAFIKGRAAISHKDYTTRDKQAEIIKNCLRQILGAMILQEYTEYQDRKTVSVTRNGVVSEMIGMVVAMKYVPGKIISDSEINTLLTKLHANDTAHGIWQITDDEVDAVRDLVVKVYGVKLIN